MVCEPAVQRNCCDSAALEELFFFSLFYILFYFFLLGRGEMSPRVCLRFRSLFTMFRFLSWMCMVVSIVPLDVSLLELKLLIFTFELVSPNSTCKM